MGKVKKEKRKSEGGEDIEKEDNWEQKTKYLCSIAQPLASRKLTKRLYKAVKKAGKQNQLRKGVREVQKYVRKGEKGLIIIAGDVSPVDVICHMPLVCEESNIPYCYVPSKDDLGSACGTNRQTCMVLLKSHEDYKEIYDEAVEDIKALPVPY